MVLKTPVADDQRDGGYDTYKPELSIGGAGATGLRRGAGPASEDRRGPGQGVGATGRPYLVM